MMRALGRVWGGCGIIATVAVVFAAAMACGDDTDRPAEKDKEKAGPKAGAGKPSYIDAMLREKWESAAIKPSAVAGDAEYMRRLYLDILGRIPSADEAADFLASKQTAKRAKLVTYLLENPDYPKNFGTMFSTTLIGRKPQGNRIDGAALTGWLRRQFAENRPWNETAYDLLTAKGSNKDNGACNYVMAHLQDGAVNLTSFTTRIFLGQQIQCTQCHDHPSNDWKQADFWGINAFFKGIRTRDETRSTPNGSEVYDHTVVYDEPSSAYSSYEKRNAIVGIAFPTFLDGRKISQGPDVDRREALAKFITEPQNEQFARAFVNRVWGHFMGRGFVQPVDDFGAHNPASHPELLDRLAAEFKGSGYDVKELIRWITASAAYNVTSAATKENEKDETLFSHMALKPMSPEQLFDSLLVATAAHKAGGDADMDRKRATWLNQFVFVFGNDEAEETATFQGTIPQALMLMNGDLMAKAVGGRQGSHLARVRDQALASRRPEITMVNRLYLSALGRYPTSGDLSRTAAFLRESADGLSVMEDLFWSLLNCNEFILNH
jgi:hypothetical protein